MLCFVVDESQISHQLTNAQTCLAYLLADSNNELEAADSANVASEAVDSAKEVEQDLNKEAPSTAAVKPKANADSRKAVSSKTKADSSSIRVAVEKVDQLINLVGELVIIQSMLTQHSQQLDHNEYGDLLSSIVQLERNSRALQESVMSIRMMPMDYVFSRFPRMVRDIATKLNKKLS